MIVGVMIFQEERGKMERDLPICKPDFEELKDSGVQAMWIGHASVLIRLDGLTVLTDPIFSDRCSPSQYFGAKRYRDTPCTIEGKLLHGIITLKAPILTAADDKF